MFLFPVTPFGNRILFPLQLQPFLHILMLTDIDCDFLSCYPFHAGNMPPKKKLIMIVACPLPSNHGVIYTDTDIHKEPLLFQM